MALCYSSETKTALNEYSWKGFNLTFTKWQEFPLISHFDLFRWIYIIHNLRKLEKRGSSFLSLLIPLNETLWKYGDVSFIWAGYLSINENGSYKQVGAFFISNRISRPTQNTEMGLGISPFIIIIINIIVL